MQQLVDAESRAALVASLDTRPASSPAENPSGAVETTPAVRSAGVRLDVELASPPDFDRHKAHQVDDLRDVWRYLNPQMLYGKHLGFRGSIERALDAGDSEAGVTVHFVTPELDGGPPVIQARVPVLPDDSADSLAQRVLGLEHVIYPMAVRWHLQRRLELTDQGAFLDGDRIPASGVQYHEDLR